MDELETLRAEHALARAGRAAEEPWVSASAVGQATYCPYQLHLARTGAARDAASEGALLRGGDAHEAWNDAQRRAGTTITLVRGALRIVSAIALAVALAVPLGWLALALLDALGRA